MRFCFGVFILRHGVTSQHTTILVGKRLGVSSIYLGNNARGDQPEASAAVAVIVAGAVVAFLVWSWCPPGGCLRARPMEPCTTVCHEISAPSRGPLGVRLRKNRRTWSAHGEIPSAVGSRVEKFLVARKSAGWRLGEMVSNALLPFDHCRDRDIRADGGTLGHVGCPQVLIE